MRRKGQAAFEFIILTGFMLIMFSLFFLVINERTATENRRAFEQQLSVITDIIEQEVSLANQVHDGYTRDFDLPTRIGEESYVISLSPTTSPASEIIVTTAEFEYVVFLPFNLSSGSTISPGTNRIVKQNVSILITALSS